jgi:hypothetical protein
MQLCSVLGAGVLGAANGVARIYNYGTSTRATYYADFEGTVSPTTGQDLPLDSNGGALVYFHQIVDVQVFDSDGALVRTFTDAGEAPSVEVKSLAFTGVNRTTAVSAAGEPTTLQAILDLWLVSAGTKDWKVLFNGVATNLSSAIASVAGLFFNVKDPAYGARGDGATDDTTAVQNCITAAGLVKGTVIFPAGTYRCTSVLSLPIGTSLWGVGAGGSVLSLDSSSANQINISPAIAAGIVPQEIRGLTLAASQANTGVVINVNGAAAVTLNVVNCIVGSSAGLNTGTAIVVVTNAIHSVTFDSCFGYGLGAASVWLSADQTLPRTHLRNTVVTCGLGAYNGNCVVARNITIEGCRFDLSAASSGVMSCVVLDGAAGAGPRAEVTGSEFIPPTGGTSGAITISSANESTTAVNEAGNIFRAGFTAIFNGFTAQSNIPSILSTTRQAVGKNVTDNTAAVNVLADQFGYTALTRTTNGNQTLTTAVGAGGAEFTMILFNNSGGASGTITYGAGFANSGATLCAAMANGKLAIQHFRAVYVNGAAAWLPLAAAVTGI